jgi:hypothetical protein
MGRRPIATPGHERRNHLIGREQKQKSFQWFYGTFAFLFAFPPDESCSIWSKGGSNHYHLAPRDRYLIVLVGFEILSGVKATRQKDPSS